MMMKYSIVCPIKDELELIPKTLPSFYAVNPSEVILCVDNPPNREVTDLIEKVATEHNAHNKTRVLAVAKNPDYKYHQAWVRRSGFLAAQNDRILTTDIDLIINKNVLNALRLIGRDNIGLASVSKFRYPGTPLKLLRLWGTTIIVKYIHILAKAYRGHHIATTNFTGLYAIWRPFWLDSEPPEELKKLRSSKTHLALDSDWVAGEDTFLKDHMILKHRYIYLPHIGGYVLSDPCEDRRMVQFNKGIYFALQGRNLLGALTRTLFRLQPHYLRGHLYARKYMRGLP